MSDHARGKGGFVVAADGIWRSALAEETWRDVRQLAEAELDKSMLKELAEGNF